MQEMVALIVKLKKAIFVFIIMIICILFNVKNAKNIIVMSVKLFSKLKFVYLVNKDIFQIKIKNVSNVIYLAYHAYKISINV